MKTCKYEDDGQTMIVPECLESDDGSIDDVHPDDCEYWIKCPYCGKTIEWNKAKGGVMHIVKELSDNLEHYINQHYDNIAPVGQYARLDREREQELDLVKRAKEWLKDQGE